MHELVHRCAWAFMHAHDQLLCMLMAACAGASAMTAPQFWQNLHSGAAAWPHCWQTGSTRFTRACINRMHTEWTWCSNMYSATRGMCECGEWWRQQQPGRMARSAGAAANLGQVCRARCNAYRGRLQTRIAGSGQIGAAVRPAGPRLAPSRCHLSRLASLLLLQLLGTSGFACREAAAANSSSQ